MKHEVEYHLRLQDVDVSDQYRAEVELLYHVFEDIHCRSFHHLGLRVIYNYSNLFLAPAFRRMLILFFSQTQPF